MTTLREAAKQALEALESLFNWQVDPERGQRCSDAVFALRAALEADDGMYGAKALTKAYENGWNAAKAETVQQGCDHCNSPLYAAIKCRVCGRVTEPVQEPATLPGPGLVICPACCSQFDPALNSVQPVQEPVAIVGTQADTWKGHEGQWLPPGPPIKTVHMLRELPEGTLLYTAPPPRLPLTEEEISEIASRLEQQGNTMRQFARAIERAHGIGGQP